MNNYFLGLSRNSQIRKVFSRWSPWLFFFVLLGCSLDSKKGDTPEGAFEVAQEFEKAERFEEAIRKYQELRNKFPYSKYAILAELAIADSYFKQESFAEAQASYQNFREMHPKHPQSDFVIYRIALSVLEQLPSTNDRDLSQAQEAISALDDLLQLFPESEHAKEARRLRKETLLRLAEKEFIIADFYFKRKVFDSAERRYTSALIKFVGLGFESRALKGMGLSLLRQGKKTEAKEVLVRMKKEWPKEVATAELEKEIGL